MKGDPVWQLGRSQRLRSNRNEIVERLQLFAQVPGDEGLVNARHKLFHAA